MGIRVFEAGAGWNTPQAYSSVSKLKSQISERPKRFLPFSSMEEILSDARKFRKLNDDPATESIRREKPQIANPKH